MFGLIIIYIHTYTRIDTLKAIPTPQRWWLISWPELGPGPGLVSRELTLAVVGVMCCSLDVAGSNFDGVT
jgi:hypothetical protein